MGNRYMIQQMMLKQLDSHRTKIMNLIHVSNYFLKINQKWNRDLTVSENYEIVRGKS